MGMIQTVLRSWVDAGNGRNKSNKTRDEFQQELTQKTRQLEWQGDEDGCKPEHAYVINVTPANFEEVWGNQENIRNEPDIKAKYLERAKSGNLFAVEIDW